MRHTRRLVLAAGAAGTGALLAACGGPGGEAPAGKVDLTKINRKLLIWGEANNAVQKAQVER